MSLSIGLSIFFLSLYNYSLDYLKIFLLDEKKNKLTIISKKKRLIFNKKKQNVNVV
jgi:hypothetical protein